MDSVFAGTDRFVIERQLGAGSMGAVYLAHDKKLGSKVALKVLLSVDATSIYRFKNEFRALADVTHKNLVTLHELFSEADQWFFTMELVQGKDLLSHVHGRRRLAYDSSPRPLSEHPPADEDSPMFDAPVAGLEMLFPSPLEDAQRLREALIQVVEGLMAVHSAGKLHRDLKPENVLVTREGRVVLLDFGIVFERKKDIHETIATIIGTPAYMSPEQCRGQGVTEATDWYALGVMLYEALTGDVPFDGTPMQVIQHKQEHDPLPPSKLVSGVPEDLDALCMKLLNRDAALRPTGPEALRALRVGDGSGIDRPLSLPPERTPEAAFLGRSTQLMELSIALAQTDEGMPVVTLLHGNAGIGKTTLIERFLREVADSQSAVVLKGRCYERESVPFKAFDNVIDSLSRYLRRLPAVDVAAMVPRDVDALAELFPVLRRVDILRRNRRPRAALKEPLAQRQRAFRALKEMFCRVADLDPLIVFVDDVQWSDVDSARLLGELITGADRPAMLLICSYRGGDTAHSPGLQALLETIRSASSELHLHDISVGTLTAEDSVQLARQLLGEDSTDEGARQVGFECGGNPQLLTQLVRHVEQRRSSGEASLATARAMVTFEHVMSRRLASLSTDARTLLELLSVAGRPVPEPVLALAASFNIDLQTALAELRSGKLVRGVATRDMRAVEVYHDTIAEAVAGAMEPAVLASWHRRLAAALEASGAMDLEALTEHLLGAGERERASLYASRAAEQAERAMAFDQAARLYGIAAEHAPTTARRLELLRRFADALVSAGRGHAAAKAYFDASELVDDDIALELRGLGAVQLLLIGELKEGFARLQGPLRQLGIVVPESFADAAKLLVEGWEALRARGYSFQARAESEVDEAQLRRLDLLWGVLRGLLLHEHDRPLPLIIQYLREALALGEPLRVVRGLSFFHAQIDIPISSRRQTTLSGAIDVAEAVARQIDNVEARAAIAFARGLSVYQEGNVANALSELTRAEELHRNHCRGGSYEMRVSRMVITHLSLAIARTIDDGLLREWLRDAEEHGDRVSTARLRFCAACSLLASDQAPQAMAQIEAAVAALGDRLEGTTATAEAMARAQIELYRGNADGALACFYVLEEFFTTALSQVRLWRGLGLLARARLALLARAGSTTLKGLREEAESAVAEADKLDLACLADDVRLVRAAIHAAHGKREAAIVELDAVLAAYPDARTPPLAALFALRAKGHALGSATGKDLVARADALIRQRHIENPRRFARLFAPGLEEAFER
jgi:serine/threonine protein kinase